MKLLSKDIENGKLIPKEFGCDAVGYNPELHWLEAPAQTKSFALVVKDPDAPIGTFYHWLVCNVPASVSFIPKDSVPAGAIQIVNDSGRKEYCAPCPPSGTHRYFFSVFALDVETLDCNSTQEFLQEIEKHKIASAEIMCPFKRK